jgi:hypothetical protein
MELLSSLLKLFVTTTVAVAVSQFCWCCLLLPQWYVTVYVPLGVFGAAVKSPLAST